LKFPLTGETFYRKASVTKLTEFRETSKLFGFINAGNHTKGKTVSILGVYDQYNQGIQSLIRQMTRPSVTYFHPEKMNFG
jgi:hypothetical protein